MQNSWQSDSDLRIKAANFFKEAKNAVCDDISLFQSLFSQGRMRLLNGVVFNITDPVQQAEFALISRCIKLLGAKTVHEKELVSLAWNQVWKNLSDDTKPSSMDGIVQGFMQKLHKHIEKRFRYVVPNYVVGFRGKVHQITIGPVRAIMAQDILPELLKEKTNPHWNIIAGDEFGIHLQPNLTFHLPPYCWQVTVQAAEGNIEEEALWLVNIAISLLRLSYPVGRYDFFPDFGDVEPMPFVKPESGKQGLIFSDNGLSGGGWGTPCLYLIDENIIAVTETEKFQSRVKTIFAQNKKSVAARFSQGLGWLTRGRQSKDQAERFLFFFTAIEALLSSDDKTAPVVQTIARHVASILEKDNTKRPDMAHKVKSLYTLRSALVHAGTRNVSRQDAAEVQCIAEVLYKNVMENIDLATSFEDFQASLTNASYGLVWPE